MHESKIHTSPGASTVKWTTHDPCLVVSKSDSKLYTNFEFCEEKNHRNLKNMWILQSHAIYDDKNKSKKNLHISGYDASGVQVGDIEQVPF